MKLKILKGKKNQKDKVAFYPENKKDIFILGRISEKRPCQINFDKDFVLESIFMPADSVIDCMIYGQINIGKEKR